VQFNNGRHAMNNTTHSNITADVVKMFGIPINSMTMGQALDLIHERISRREKLQIGVVNAAKVVNMQNDPVLHDDVLSSDIILADGMSVVWAGKLLGRPLPERVTGIDLMMKLLDRGNEHRYRVYLLGASEEVSKKVEDNIRRDFPNVVVAGRNNGYYTDAEEPAVVEKIAAANADILFVAMTSPKKEKFIAKWNDKLNVTVRHGVGGSFDVYSGKVERAPEIWMRLGLEWLYRVKQEPGRLWKRYLFTNLKFCKLVLTERFKK